MELHRPETTTTKPLKTDSNFRESEVRKVLNDFHQAILDQNINKLMTFYSSDVVAFDMVPPLQYVGRDNYRKSWEDAFAHSGKLDDKNSGYDVHDLKVVAGEDVAFCYALNHCYGPMDTGEKIDMWMRSTQCLKKINGKWLIVHEQYSLPTNFETGESLMDLKPESKLH